MDSKSIALKSVRVQVPLAAFSKGPVLQGFLIVVDFDP